MGILTSIIIAALIGTIGVLAFAIYALKKESNALIVENKKLNKETSRLKSVCDSEIKIKDGHVKEILQLREQLKAGNGLEICAPAPQRRDGEHKGRYLQRCTRSLQDELKKYIQIADGKVAITIYNDNK